MSDCGSEERERIADCRLRITDLKNLFFNSQFAIRNSRFFIAGVDEAGRGPLAGPVVAAAVILEKSITGVADSKSLSAKKREALFSVITKEAISWKISVIDHTTIDEINILQATFRAMAEAVSGLSEKPELVLVDGPYPIPHLEIKQKPIIKGDKTIYLISAASIIAKVSRDRIMKEYDKIYPLYGFAKHKGYPTKSHIDAIRIYGPSPIHRISFMEGKKYY
ncbi:ribonuclease HII [bacterium]|nr:ribonuclease HII [bacterium]MBU1598944.1 ribonuclease HII [bacterium]MBU2462163.1 ribonuclease HII [bacterium]